MARELQPVSPVIFRIGSLEVYGYGMMIGLGLLLCFGVLSAEGRRRGLDALVRDLPSLYLWMFGAGWLGGKLYFIATSQDEFNAIVKTGNWVRIFGQGFVFYGSLLTCLPLLLWWLKKRQLPILPSIDTVILAAPIMLGTGRIGCFLAGCCYGSRCDGPWAVTFHHGEGLNGVALHPAQLYETLGCYLVFAILWFGLRRRQSFDGQITAAYFDLYGIERFLVECFRGDVARSFLIGGGSLKPGDPPTGLSFSQGVSVLLVAGGIVWLVRGTRRARLRRPRQRAG